MKKYCVYFLNYGLLNMRLILNYGLQNFFKLSCQKIAGRSILSFKKNGMVLYINNDQNALYHIVNSYEKIRKSVDYLPDDTKYIVDIGANCGWFSILAKKRFPDAQIVAFEPSPTLSEVLEKNFNQIDIILIKKAISSSTGNVSFYINSNSEQTNSIYKEYVKEAGGGESEISKIDVPAIALDDCIEISKWKRIDVIKIDVQGAELDVLQGAEMTIKKTLSLMVEIWLVDKNCVNVLKLINNNFRYHKYVNPVYAGADIFFTKNE